MAKNADKQPRIVYFDANYSEYIAEAFHQLEICQEEIDVQSTKRALAEDATDEEVIALVSENNGILFTQDIDFRKVPILKQIIKENNIGVFIYKQHHTPYWDLVRLLINCWADARKFILKEKRPFIYRITTKGGKAKFESEPL